MVSAVGEPLVKSEGLGVGCLVEVVIILDKHMVGTPIMEEVVMKAVLVVEVEATGD